MKISAQLLFTHVIFIVAFEAFLFVQLAFVYLTNCISSTLSNSSYGYCSLALRFFAMYTTCAILVLLFSSGYHYIMGKVVESMRNSKIVISSTVIIGLSVFLGLLMGSFVQYVAIILNRIEVKQILSRVMI